MKQRLIDIYNGASAATRWEGRDWYSLALLEAVQMALQYHVPVRCAAGIIAALSPRKKWAQNLKQARELLKNRTVPGIGHFVRTATSIMNGSDPVLALRGPKTLAFYEAIMGNVDAVVVDVWMLRALGVEKQKITPKQYAQYAEVVREAALDCHEHPAEFQAIVWCAIRGGAK